MIVDSHCHLDFPDFSQDIDDVINRAVSANVKYIINVASNLDGCKNGALLASKRDNLFHTFGIHPHHANEVKAQDYETIEKMFLSENKKAVAIGEVGLDFYKGYSPREIQKKVFVEFLRLKDKLRLPLVVHSREASEDTLDIIRSELNAPVDGVMHCFSQGKEYLREVLDLGMHVSFTCSVTFNNALRLREVVKYVPLDRMLLETDAPFLAPQRFRGKRNEPAYLVYLVDALADILQVSRETIEKVSTENANRLFRLGLEDV